MHDGSENFLFSEQFISESISILSSVDTTQVERCAAGLADVRKTGGRLFILGVGGSAGHASHAVNDFRKICGIEAYAPTDNVSELTARTNDDGWETTFESWLRISRLGPQDGILVFSVGGGDVERQVSVNLVRALQFGLRPGSRIFGIVGRTGGFTAGVAEACVVIPPMFDRHVTPHTEGVARSSGISWCHTPHWPSPRRSGSPSSDSRVRTQRSGDPRSAASIVLPQLAEGSECSANS